MMRLATTGLFLAVAASPSLANDSSAEMALGGLVLTPSQDISLDREDLYISPTEVRVKYAFTNHATADVDTLVAFPLPDQRFDGMGEDPFWDFAANTKFRTLVEGKPVKLDTVVQAFFKDVDVSARLASLGLPTNGLADIEAFHTQIGLMDKALRQSLLAEGLLVNTGSEDQPYYQAGWNVRTTVTRRQVFPAGKTIAVEHRYVPLAGGSVGGGLGAEARRGDWGKEHTAKYCIEDDWYASFDRQLKKRQTEDNPAPYSETWLGYVLKSGANWQGPIKDFRLVVDKGKPEALVSFCAEGVKKISPTQFEVRKSNFEPKDDLNILIVNWWSASE